MSKCICGKELEGKQVYCSQACRKRASRERSVTEGEAVTVTSVTIDPDNVTVSIPSVTIAPSVTFQDDIWKPGFDLSEAGFLRRNKGWPLFNAKFKADTVKGATKAHRWNMEAIANHAKLSLELGNEGAEGK